MFAGSLKSPGFPGNYPADQNCLWLLHTNQDAELQLFCDLIELQDCVVSEITSILYFSFPLLRFRSSMNGKFPNLC
jgi:hypothetical protein